jgi:hypothetical protein
VEVSGKVQSTIALLKGKALPPPQCSLNGTLGGHRADLDALGRRILLSLPGEEPRFLLCPPHSPVSTDCLIGTVKSWTQELTLRTSISWREESKKVQ